MDLKKLSDSTKKYGRMYPEKTCKNLECDYGKKFTPHDRRQIFCSKQCGINYRNDQRSKDLHTVYAENKKLRNNDLLLEKLFLTIDNVHECLVHLNQLDLFGFDSNYCVAREKYKDGRFILWMYRFGVVANKKDSDWFEILKRNART